MCCLFRPGGRGWRGVRRSKRKEEEEQMDKRLGLNTKQMYLLKVREGHLQKWKTGKRQNGRQ